MTDSSYPYYVIWTLFTDRAIPNTHDSTPVYTLYCTKNTHTHSKMSRNIKVWTFMDSLAVHLPWKAPYLV